MGQPEVTEDWYTCIDVRKYWPLLCVDSKTLDVEGWAKGSHALYAQACC